LGDLDLNLNGGSVINSDPANESPLRDLDEASFISGNFVRGNAEAIIGSFGLSEENVNIPNHIEGVFIVE